MRISWPRLGSGGQSPGSCPGGLSSIPTPVNVGFVIDKVALWQVLLRVQFLPPPLVSFNQFFFFFFWLDIPKWPWASSFRRGFMITHFRHTTIGRTPLDEWPARRRDLYLTTHNTYNRQTSMPPVGFEPTILVSERPKTHALDRTATGIGLTQFNTIVLKITTNIRCFLFNHRPEVPILTQKTRLCSSFIRKFGRQTSFITHHYSNSINF
jgi:hypothetical protein